MQNISHLSMLFFRRPGIPEFRRGGEGENLLVVEDRDEASDTLGGVRCPICKWRPMRSSLWTCWDCDHPEYFYDGCGTSWNTFETRGMCPTCEHQWKWTTCHSCLGWSRHLDWYEKDNRDRAPD